MTVIQFQPKKRASKNRNRDEVLSVIVPKILGKIWDSADIDQRFGLCAIVNGNIAIGASKINWGGFCIHVYLFDGDDAKKVLSLHLGDRATTTEGFDYMDGRCAVLNWKRGDWEDTIAALDVVPRTLPHLTTAGISRRRFF